MEKLHFLSGPLQGAVIELTEQEITIGRSSSSTIRLNDESVSEYHAIILRHGQNCVVQDSGSTTGTFVRGEKVIATTLEDGDRIAFGSVEARFETSAHKTACPQPDAPDESSTPPTSRSRVPKLLSVGVLLLLLVIIVGNKIHTKLTKTGNESPRSNVSQPGAYFKTHWQDESQFIVETIVRDLAEMAFYAKHKTLPVPEAFSVAAKEKTQSLFRSPTYEVEISLEKSLPTIKVDLNINGPIWSPTLYGGLAQKLFEVVGLSPGDRSSSNAQDSSLLATLTEITARNIEEQNQETSKLLSERFCDAFLHEKAAVILGAFMMREHARCFSEIRSPLCRLTAHLVMASRLATPSDYGTNGQFAEAMLLTLMNNQKAALEKLARLEGAPPALQSWVRALRTRNTHDYRLLAGVKQLTLLEKIEFFRASCHSIDVQIFWDRLSDSDKRNVPDYCRIANEYPFSVETGHQLLAISLPLEFIELAAIYSLSEGAKLKKEQLVEVLNRMPERCFDADGKAKVHIIGRGQWAAFSQRHICHAIDHNFRFLQDKWGVREKALEFSQQMGTLFSGLRLYPFVRRLICMDEKSYRQSVDDGFAVTVATPHLVPPRVWNNLCFKVGFAPLYQPNPNPHINEWHKHNPPPGTAYDPLPRMNHPSLVERADTVSRLEELHALAPYDSDIASNLLRIKYKTHPTYEQMEEVCRPVLEYDSYQLYRLAGTVQDRPAKYEPLMLKAAAIDPYRYYALSEYFIERKEEAKAADYLEKAMKLHPDAVAAANESAWLIKYYQRKGMLSKAMELADQAAEVYSHRGLRAKAELLESLGKYAEALEYYKKIEERYNDSSVVILFLARYKAKTGGIQYEKELEGRLKTVFPNGIEKITLNELRSPPQDGVSIDEENTLIRQAGLKRSDIIVALYGIRVHNFKQYAYAREYESKPEMDFIVWTGSQYVEVKASPPEHRFGVQFSSYVRH